MPARQPSCHLYPIDEFIIDHSPTSNAEGRMAFHHAGEALEFSGQEYGNWLGMRFGETGTTGTPQYVCVFSVAGREVHRVRYDDPMPGVSGRPRKKRRARRHLFWRSPCQRCPSAPRCSQPRGSTMLNYSPEAMRLITRRSLLAFDNDNTIKERLTEPHARLEFLRNVMPLLFEAASNGTRIALITGNSPSAAAVFLRWLCEDLLRLERPDLLGQFDLIFCGAGAWCQFPLGDEQLTAAYALASKPETRDEGARRFREAIFDEQGEACGAIAPRLIVAPYLQTTRIPDADLDRIRETSSAVYRTFIDAQPKIQLRTVRYLHEAAVHQAVPQVALVEIPEPDKRPAIAEAIRKALNPCGPGEYLIKPAGKRSIDITRSYLDKAFALRALLAGRGMRGRDAVYYGDEVVPGGNDIEIADIEGLLVLAVDNIEQIPLRRNIIAPLSGETGPAATVRYLRQYNDIAHRQLKLYDAGRAGPAPQTAAEAFARKLFADRIRVKAESLETWPTETLEALHFVTTLSSRDYCPAIHRLLASSVAHLDAVLREMRQPLARLPALGASGEACHLSSPSTNPEA